MAGGARFYRARIVEPELAQMNLETSALPVMDFKSALQETLQASGRAQPVYVLVKEEGPEHRKTFTVEARLPEAEGNLWAGPKAQRKSGRNKRRRGRCWSTWGQSHRPRATIGNRIQGRVHSAEG